MNWYIVYGIRACNMCNNTETDILGIILMDHEDEEFELDRHENDIGFHVCNNEHYLNIVFKKINVLDISDFYFKSFKRK